MKKVLSLIMVLLCCFLYSCKKEEVKQQENALPKEPPKQTEEKKPEPKEEEIEIPRVEVIYEKNPKEAADKCLAAFKSGNLVDATAYVMPDGKAFEELGRLKSKMIASFAANGSNEVLKLAEKLANSAFGQFVYTLKETKINGNDASLIYSVSMPDMEKINYSKYSDAYMSHIGMTQEQMMTELEGMTESEMQEWSNKYTLGLMIYVFESGEALAQKTGTTTVKLKKHENGWLVSEIKNE